MTFFNGTTTMDAYVDLITDQLVATGVWSQPDVAFYPALATPAKRVITDGTVFVFIQRIVSNANSSNIANGTGSTRFNEIRVTFGTGYDLGTHALTGTIQNCGVPFEVWQKANSGNAFYLNNDVGSGNKSMQHFTWVDPTGSVTAVVVATSAAATFDYVCFFNLERNTTKQYADGFSNVYWTCFPAYNYMTNTSSGTATNAAYFSPLPNTVYSALRDVAGNLSFGAAGGQGNLNRPVYFHAFNGAPTFDEPVLLGYSNSSLNDALYHPSFPFSSVNTTSLGGRYPGIETFFSAYRSPADSKAYFQFPWYNNSANPLRRSLIAQTQDLWFDVGDGSYGLVDGDIIDYTAPGPILKRYLVKQLANPEPTIGDGNISVAIRFA